MDFSSLYSLIRNLQYGTNLHISIVYFGNYINSHCNLPRRHTIHIGEMCNYFKENPESYKKCCRCNTLAQQRAAHSKTPLSGLCIHGVYEYTRPIFIEDKLFCILRIGNILTDSGREKLCKKARTNNLPFDKMESNYDYEKCNNMGEIIESYIRMLIEKYPEASPNQKSLIKNIKNYINTNYEHDITVSSIAHLFSYNEAYMGRIFKKEVGISMNDYINLERIKNAKKLLLTNKSVTLISQVSGYNNISYFNRTFKKITGQTPTEYRDTINKTS